MELEAAINSAAEVVGFKTLKPLQRSSSICPERFYKGSVGQTHFAQE